MRIKCNDRQALARLRRGKCLWHNTPIVSSQFFDGGTCSLGCVALNTSSAMLARKIRADLIESRR